MAENSILFEKTCKKGHFQKPETITLGIDDTKIFCRKQIGKDKYLEFECPILFFYNIELLTMQGKNGIGIVFKYPQISCELRQYEVPCFEKEINQIRNIVLDFRERILLVYKDILACERNMIGIVSGLKMETTDRAIIGEIEKSKRIIGTDEIGWYGFAVYLLKEIKENGLINPIEYMQIKDKLI